MDLTNDELKELIKAGAKEAVKEMQKKKMYSEAPTYKKTEYLLQNYRDLKSATADNELTKKTMDKLDTILDSLKGEPYYKIIDMYYMESKKMEVIAGELGVSISTVYSVKKRLVEQISVRLYADHIMREIIKGE